MIILVVRPRSWRKVDSLSFGGGLCSIYFLLYQKIHPLRDAAYDADCLPPLRILKMITVSLKDGF